jgi:hypothetical protein
LHDRHISGIFAFEDTGNKSTGLRERVRQAGPVTHQATGFRKLSPFIYRGHETRRSNPSIDYRRKDFSRLEAAARPRIIALARHPSI